MNLNLKMTVVRSKRRSYFLSLVFITKIYLQKGKQTNKQTTITKQNKQQKLHPRATPLTNAEQ